MWQEGTMEFNGRIYHWQAKVYELGSRFGIDGGPVSKLWIRQTDVRPKWSGVVYNYDRGLDIDHAPDGLVSKLVAHLEANAGYERPAVHAALLPGLP